MNREQLPNPKDFKHRIDIDLRFNDIDLLGHLNNTVYLSLYDTGKARYFNVVRQGKMNWQRIETVIANINCAFVEPIFFGDEVQVLSRCTEIGEKSFTVQQMLINKNDERIYSVCESVMVAYDPATKSTIPVNEEWIEQLNNHEGRELRKIIGTL